MSPAKKKTPAAEPETLPPLADASELVEFLNAQPKARDLLIRSSNNPPQVLLLEGGTTTDRKNAAVFKAVLHNCPEMDDEGEPCLACLTCRRFMENVHRDFFFLDGGAESIKIDQIREIRPLFGQPPHDQGFRIVVLHDAQYLTIEAANSLLKSLEEPVVETLFILTVPQREKLLPTLVSRSWVLTLAQTAGEDRRLSDEDPETAEIYDDLCRFIRSGREWFQHTSSKGRVTRDVALKLLRELSRELIIILGERAEEVPTSLPADHADIAFYHAIGSTVAECEEALMLNVAPALVMDKAALALHLMYNGMSM